ncbi:MAG: TolC family protein [Erythrobacter sp.]|jgi:cobalt-zinc-cadmium efflux system outer membrane protein|uniref:Metal transporter n=2 Tax=Alphaproteobacteria TaxID=28211 RepID=A0A0N9UZ99_SPHMC|nr:MULTISPECIES: TolC family protein [Erythrobacteraceae]ALH81222.1 metal transporter [Sphingopyxis macrogoltabida]KEO86831.1 metal transporter [Erythrobacter sp. JL475]MBO6769058.1 TolC family protein [Erythrobacter sp.]MBX7541850.1 TolC family protein [Qipengyuania sphaerica]MCK0099566.1 TolC family protein [Qipengyuania sp. S6317L1]
MRCIALAAALMAASIGSQTWAQNTITLDEALERAGVGTGAEDAASVNPRVYGPLAEEEAARAAITQARLRPNPELSFEAENVAGTGAFSGLQSSEYTLGFAQQIELGGKRRARIGSAEASARIAGVRRDMSTAELALAVRERYIAAVAAGQRVELAREIVERNRELARIATVLVEVGREPPLRAMRAQASLAEAEAQLQAAEADEIASSQALTALWVPTEEPWRVASSFPDISPPVAPNDASDPLPLRLAGARTELAQAEIARERSLRVPDPSVMAGVRRFEGSNDQAFIVGVTIPLPFGNRNQGNIAAAEAQARAAQAQEAIVEADYRLEFERTLTLYRSAETRVETLSRASLPQAEEALRLVEIGYRNGRFPLIEVLAAAEARDAIRENLIQAEETRGVLAARLIWLTAE